LVALFVARGISLLCVIPPLEQWDEYQHIAYIQHFADRGEAPVLLAADAVVGDAVLRQAASMPQPAPMLGQTAGTGARSYAEYWEGLRTLASLSPQPRVLLYEAQQGSLYYRLAGPVFRAWGGLAELRSSIAALRICNLLLAAAALGIALHTFGVLFEDRRLAALAGLLIASQPLFLLNALRVANDELAIAAVTIAVAWAVQPHRHDSIVWAMVAGAAGGVAFLAKGFGLLVAPLLCLAVGLSIGLGQVPRARGALVLSVALVVGVLVAAPQLLFNLEHYGSATGMIEALLNRDAGRGFAGLLGAAAEIRWPPSLAYFWLEGSSWVGGWSFLRVGSTLRSAVVTVLVLMLCGWGLAIWPRRRAAGRPFRVEGTAARLSAVVVLTTLALAYHMLHSHLAHGQITTNPWYGALAYPWALALACAGCRYWPLDLLRLGLPWLLIGLYVVIEVSGAVLMMLPAYTGGASGLLALERLAELQPSALGTLSLLLSATLGIGLLGLAALRCAFAFPSPPPPR
jgi:hypothetical protein